MKCFDFDPNIRWLFCMTHPDDELAIACFLKCLVEAGAEVHISWTHSNPEREKEGRCAACEIGVKADRLHFFDGKDGRITFEIERLLPRFQSLAKTVNPDRVVCGAFEQGHLDHDATHFLIHRSFSCPILEVPLYHTYAHFIQKVNEFSDPTDAEFLLLSEADFRFKSDLARLYPSQRIRDILVWLDLYNQLFGRRSLWKVAESMRQSKVPSYNIPNHPHPMSSKVERSLQWRRWKAAIEPHLS